MKSKPKITKKIRVAVLCGGKSAEHEISLQSAQNVVAALDKNKYEVTVIGINKAGGWKLLGDSKVFLSGDKTKFLAADHKNRNIAIIPGEGNGQLIGGSEEKNGVGFDVVFPVLHGPFGEDGTVQGLLKLADVPFVGSGVLGSAVAMDKDAAKRLLRDSGIPVAPSVVIIKKDAQAVSYEKILKILGTPFFIKPANLGSSVGVHKVKNKKEFRAAIKDAFSYDAKILAEEYIRGREIECSVLVNENLIASLPGEVIPAHEFYSYEAKYLDENGARLVIPAKLPKNIIARIQRLAVQSCRALCIEGMARVDFFLKSNGELLVNEINTIPGFTNISMYPKLWEASGISYPKLIDKLIELAIERFKKEQKLKTNYLP
jgi:D-alanine-D-alanine ligase